MNHTRLFLALALFAAPALHAQGGKPADTNNGTDPTKPVRTAELKYEHLDLNGSLSKVTFYPSFSSPIGNGYTMKVRVPVTSLQGVRDESYGLGDAELMVGRIFGLSRKGGYVAQGQVNFNTASRAELGTGKTVLKGTFIWAKFLAGGAILAPSLVQQFSVGGDEQRADVNNATFDLYYVPKMADARNLMTWDPALSFDWENNKSYFSLGVQYGRVLGPMLGGKGIVFVKPTVFAGDDKPGTWGIEAGFRVLGF